MFATSADVLNMSLAIGFIVLSIFLSFFIFYGILILRDITKVVDDTAQVVHKVKKTVIEPLRALDYIVEKAKPYIEMAVEKRTKKNAKGK